MSDFTLYFRMMVKQQINIVWLKRDLRLRDHVPLAAAIDNGLPTLLLFCFEPSLMACPESDVRHWRFAFESLADLQNRLKAREKQLYAVHQEVITVLEWISDFYQIQQVYSHEEVGIKITFDRDKAVKKWCSEQSIVYQEFPQNGIIRGRKHRQGWLKLLEKSTFKASATKVDLEKLQTLSIDPVLLEKFTAAPLPSVIQSYQEGFQRGGETYAWRYFQSFLQERSKNYNRQLSKPAGSRTSCSRLSPYLAFGCISTREVIHYLDTHLAQSADRWNLNNFRSRLWWRSHFIQKLETDWRVEIAPINPVFVQLDRQMNGPWFEAWAQGQTGFPMVDASMRCLQATGWINFRMRAMLVSFATFVLWLDWRPVATHLARLFLDFEPGIHYPQIQMQAGLTGYHTLRMYNPSTQVTKNDPDGIFIKKWVPELQAVPSTLLAEPWKMTTMEQKFYHCSIGKDYPAPLVDFDKVAAQNKDRYWQIRQSPAAKQILNSVLEKFCTPKEIKIHQQKATRS